MNQMGKDPVNNRLPEVAGNEDKGRRFGGIRNLIAVDPFNHPFQTEEISCTC